MKLKVKERISTLHKKFEGWHLSITSNENQDNNFYVTKEETRSAGPWSDEDEEIYIPSDVKRMTELRPWQQSLVDHLSNYYERTVDVVYDPAGTYRDWETDRKSTRLNSSHSRASRMPSSA